MGWKEYLEQNCANYKNFVLLGEAGSGKSEIALNLAAHLAQCQPLPVHFFDLDMTKPLFRSRDLAEEMEALGVHFQNHIVVGLILPSVLISGNGHQHFVKP